MDFVKTIFLQGISCPNVWAIWGRKILKYGWQIQKEDCMCDEGFQPHMPFKWE